MGLFANVAPCHRAARLWVPLVLVCLTAGCRLVRRSSLASQEVADARRLTNLGLAAADSQDLVRAEGLLEEAVKRCPDDVDSRRHYAELLWDRGEKMAAVGQIAQALRLSPGDVDLCIVGGRMYADLGLLDDADRLAREAVRNAPRSAAAWHLHAQVALARGRAIDALADLQHSLAFEPHDRDVLLETAEVYRQLGRPKRALATLAILEETYGPNQTPAHVLALEGMAQEALGRRVDAIESYQKALGKDATVPGVADRLAALAAPEAAPLIRR